MDVILSLWSTLGLPATVLAFACALVRGAKFLENGASEEALRYISGLLRKGPLTAFGPLGAAVVPLIFKALLGSSPLSLKFIARSIILSLAFWLVLILIKHPVWNSILHSLTSDDQVIYVVPAVLLIDWISLAKASLVLQFMSLTKKRGWTLTFVVIDILLTCTLVISVYPIIYSFLILNSGGDSLSVSQFLARLTFVFGNNIAGYVVMAWMPLVFYVVGPRIVDIQDVFIPSTLMTSSWVILFLVSSLITGLLLPLEYLRRFTVWWFKDIDTRPLTVIARVAATLIVVVALVFNAARWVWLIV
jgi:hypothetical protein